MPIKTLSKSRWSILSYFVTSQPITIDRVGLSNLTALYRETPAPPPKTPLSVEDQNHDSQDNNTIPNLAPGETIHKTRQDTKQARRLKKIQMTTIYTSSIMSPTT